MEESNGSTTPPPPPPLPVENMSEDSNKKQIGKGEKVTRAYRRKTVDPNKLQENEARITQVVEAALKAGKKFNMIVMERTEEMMQLAHSLILEMQSYSSTEHEVTTVPTKAPPVENDSEIAASMMPVLGGTVKTENINSSNQPTTTEQKVIVKAPNQLLKKLHHGLESLQDHLQQLQFTSVQTEVDLIKEVKLPTAKLKKVSQVNGITTSTSLKGRKKGTAFRLYTPEQQAKLEEWYQLSSRPEAAEIMSMYKIINSDQYAAKEIQPEGISSRQIRIWFDNRRAKERLDYMKAKMKDARTKGLDPETIKKMKTDYLNEAKEVLEARVARLRENTQGALMIIEESRGLDTPLEEVKKRKRGSNTSASSSMAKALGRKRLRLDFTPSVNKAIKDARSQGLTDFEVDEIKTKTIENVRQRLNLSEFNIKPDVRSENGCRNEVTYCKDQFESLLSNRENLPAPELLGDLIEFLYCLDISSGTLSATGIIDQLNSILTFSEYKGIPWLTSKIEKVLEKFQYILTTTPGATASSSNTNGVTSSGQKKVRIKFTMKQLKKLEKYYKKNSQPNKNQILEVVSRLNTPPLRDMTQNPVKFKQVRCWFYKRRSANEPPLSLQESHDAEESNESDDTFLEEHGGNDDFDNDDTSSTTPNKTKDRESKGGRIFSHKQVEFISREYDIDPRPEAKNVDAMCELLNTAQYQDKSKSPFGVTRRQIMTWFSNRRAKERQDYVKVKVRQAKANGATADEIERVREIADNEIKDIIDARSKPRLDGRGKYKREKRNIISKPNEIETKQGDETESDTAEDLDSVDADQTEDEEDQLDDDDDIDESDG